MLCTNYQPTRNNSYLGKFSCPLPGMAIEKVYCCGDVNSQYCCSHMETVGAKWGLAVGIVIGILIFAVLAYTIHAIRALDRCYHECPACGNDETFKFDCRWYTVSNEGNRYGVTFHSRKFAKQFIEQLATRYGQWNQADILRIKKDGKDYVVLNIYFHDMFTPWFYTQGPMKNDTEWINTDFVELVTLVKQQVRVPLCCGRTKAADPEAQQRKVTSRIRAAECHVHVRIDEPDTGNTHEEDEVLNPLCVCSADVNVPSVIIEHVEPMVTVPRNARGRSASAVGIRNSCRPLLVSDDYRSEVRGKSVGDSRIAKRESVAVTLGAVEVHPISGDIGAKKKGTELAQLANKKLQCGRNGISKDKENESQSLTRKTKKDSLATHNNDSNYANQFQNSSVFSRTSSVTSAQEAHS